MESYILTRTMHLGFIKESFGKGAVLKYYPEKSMLVVEGRKFEDYRDIEILKKQAVKKPHDPWIIPYSEEARAVLLGESTETAPVVPRGDSEKMPVIQSDADAHETIDISHTKVSKIANAAKEAERNRVKSNDLPVIKADQSVEERIAELKEAKATDLSARAERVRLMKARKAKMPIMQDDSLGAGAGSKASAMNAGMPVGGKRAEETPKQVADAAAARKAEIEANRKKVAADMGVDPEQAGIDEATPMPAETPVLDEFEKTSVAGVAKDEEIAALKAELEGKTQPLVDPRDAEIAALKAQLAEFDAVKEMDKPEAPRQAKKMPVISEE